MSYKKTIENLRKRYDSKVEPLQLVSLPKFSEEIGGIDFEEYILMFGPTGSSKTRLCVRLFVLDLIKHAYQNPKDEVEVAYFSTELSADAVWVLIFCAVLHEHTGKIYSPKYFRNREKENKLNEGSFKEFEEVRETLDFIQARVTIYDNVFTPNEIFYTLKTNHLDKGFTEGKDGKMIKNEPDKRFLFVLDTINATKRNEGERKEESIRELSANTIKQTLKMTYGLTSIVIQQTDKQSSTAEYYKGEPIQAKFKPRVENLGVVKTTPDDASLVISIYHPSRYGVKECEGYSVQKHGKNFRYLEVVKASNIEEGIGVALVIDNANMQVKELEKPKKEDNEEEPLKIHK